jgi:hypothetical protein
MSNTARNILAQFSDTALVEIAEIARVAIERHRDDISEQCDLSDEYLDGLFNELCAVLE